MPGGTLVLGGGFGGLATSAELRRLLGPDYPVTVVDRREGFYVGHRKLWALVGQGTVEEGTRPLARLAEKGIRFVRADVLAIDPAAREVETDEGVFRGDHLVVALGAEPRADLVPGLVEHAFNLYDPRAVAMAAERVAALESGRVAVVIAGLPYKCPPAPYEAVFMLDDHFRGRGIRDRIDLTFTTLQPALLPNAGPEGARWIGERLSARGVAWEVARRPLGIQKGEVVFEGGDGRPGARLAFDLGLVVPPHRAPPVVRTSPLTEGEWVPVDRGTLETRFPGVWAIGDVTHIPLGTQAALPKAGLMAEAEGVRVARAIAAEITGGEAPPAFDGRGHCFLEMGGGKAARLDGDFFHEGGPDVRISEESGEHLREKYRFESDRLEAWLE